MAGRHRLLLEQAGSHDHHRHCTSRCRCAPLGQRRRPHPLGVPDALTVTKRNIIRYARIPQALFFSTVQPIMFVLLFRYVFGGAIHVPGTSYVNYLMPGVFVQTVVFGSVQTSIGLAEDLQTGIIERFRALPMARSAVLAGRTTADLARNVLTVVIITVVGFLVGFRPTTGVLPYLAGILVILLFAYALSWGFAVIGLSAPNSEVAQVISFPILFPLVFASSAFVPVGSMPSWLQGFATYQPVSVTISACRALMIGGPTRAGCSSRCCGRSDCSPCSCRWPSTATAPESERAHRAGGHVRSQRAEWGHGSLPPPRSIPTPSAPARRSPSATPPTRSSGSTRLADRFDIARLPYSIKVVLENLLRHEDGVAVRPRRHRGGGRVGRPSRARTGWAAGDASEIALTPERVLMQDLTGVPGVVDLAAMRDALSELGGDPARINPLVPVELVVDHSVIAEASGSPGAFDENVDIEYQRNIERYQLLRWAQQAFDGFRVVPPGTGICHQVNLEYLSRVVFATEDGRAFCDTLVGTDSHTTMVNGLGVLGLGRRRHRGRGGHARPALLHAPPPGRRASASPASRPPGTTATDLVLTITELLAPARRGGQVRRVLRARRRCGAAREPGHDRQHVARVRRDLHDLPDRRGHARLPALHRA